MSGTSDETSPNNPLGDHYQAWSVALNHMPFMALRCARELGIPDIISSQGGSVTLEELVAQLSIPPPKSSHLCLIMKLLVHLGYFAIQINNEGQQGYTLTSSSKLLVASSSNPHLSLAPFFLLMSDPVCQMPCFHMADWFRGPHFSAFEVAHGISILEYMEKHPSFSTAAIKTNACHSELEMRGLLKYLIPKLEGSQSLVDVGGGSGAVANVISQAAPHLKCIVFDLPSVISEAIQEDNSNVTFQAGDLTQFIPSADIVFFKGTLTMFNHEECLKILTMCYQAFQCRENRGKLILIEKVKYQTNGTFDLTTLQLSYDTYVMTYGGEERTETQWEKLFLDSGFTSYKITPTCSINSIIEVFP